MCSGFEVDVVAEVSNKIVGHFTISNVTKKDGKWSEFAIVAALKDELNRAQI
jgi:hypothetical protein